MTQNATEFRTVVIEREMPHPPEKIWRAITEQNLIAEWLMTNDFKPVAGHGFTFSADWGSVDGKVLTVEPNKTLSYTWDAMGLESVVVWTLTPTASGTTVRMEQSGFKPEHDRAYSGAQYGWKKFFGALEEVVARN
jgi:uncharacterized protein YndB with AHSA1/START domain